MSGVNTSGSRPAFLVSTDWLQTNLDDLTIQVVDIRGYVQTAELGGGRQHADYVAARDEYDDGHIPGAVFVDWTVDIVDPEKAVKAQLAGAERFAGAMASRGIGDDTLVVAVDHTGGHFATRLWWALTYYGHDAVVVLDGGWAKWVAEGRPISSEMPRPKCATFTPRNRPELAVDADGVSAAIGDPSTLIVDARDANQYTGEVQRGSRGGHIPSAVHIPAKSLFNADGTWKSPPELADILTMGGVDDRRTVAYCNGGVTATAVLFALAQTGQTNWANYDGSWNEWGERHDLAVESNRDLQLPK